MCKKCSECGNCVLIDYGYSNYTVEGTSVNCALGLNPNGEFDLWYGEDKRDRFADECSSYIKDDPVCIDVDKEDVPWNLRFEEGSEKWQNYATQRVSSEQIYKLMK